VFVGELPPAAAVAFENERLPVVALPYIETGDAYSARVLERMRQRLTEGD
jgi:hypothetical protein